MRIVVDVMGGDHGCGVVIEGVKLALHANSKITALYLVGNESEIHAGLSRCNCRDPRVQVMHAPEVLTMEEKPVVGLRKKKNCSIARAVDLVKQGQAEALVSPGNTGGVVAASTIKLRPLPGVDRPAIAAVIPAPQNEFVLLDAGANVECKPLHLLQFAIMGSVYSREVLHYRNPRVGLLSVGTEDIKGNELTQEAFKLCKQIDLNFIGNVEGHDLFANNVDVVVCDGFVGNVVLKTCESLAGGIFDWLKRELTSTLKRKLGAYLAKGAFRTIKRRMDPDAYGGAPLLGLNGNVFIAHGSARERAIMNAIRMATEAVQSRITQVIAEEVGKASQRLALDNALLEPVQS
ncbi:MAG: phosphate acyltransferase PlsX [Verrucomicrobiota bacterium]